MKRAVFLLALALILACGTLGWYHNKATNERAQLEGELRSTQDKLASAMKEGDRLTGELKATGLPPKS